MATTLPTMKLNRVDALPTSGYEVGGVYFVRSENKIYLRTESGWECYDGDIDTLLDKRLIKTDYEYSKDLYMGETSSWGNIKIGTFYTNDSLISIDFSIGTTEVVFAKLILSVRSGGGQWGTCYAKLYGDYADKLKDHIFIDTTKVNDTTLGTGQIDIYMSQMSGEYTRIYAHIACVTPRKAPEDLMQTGLTTIPTTATVKPTNVFQEQIASIGGGSSVTTDTAMSDSSTNPVQNKVIKSYVDGLVGTAITQLSAI